MVPFTGKAISVVAPPIIFACPVSSFQHCAMMIAGFLAFSTLIQPESSSRFTGVPALGDDGPVVVHPQIGMAIADLHDNAALAAVSDRRRRQEKMAGRIRNTCGEPSLRVARIVLEPLKASVGQERYSRSLGRLILVRLVLSRLVLGRLVSCRFILCRFILGRRRLAPANRIRAKPLAASDNAAAITMSFLIAESLPVGDNKRRTRRVTILPELLLAVWTLKSLFYYRASKSARK